MGFGYAKKTLLFLHDIGDFRLRAIRAYYLTEGLAHGHSGHTAPNALVLQDVNGIITFVMQYVENNGILLPGRVRGYKRDDIKLHPSSATKRAVWMLYQESAMSLSLRSVAYTTFCKVWRNFLADVVVYKPMTDLCITCQKKCCDCTFHHYVRRGKIRGMCIGIHVHVHIHQVCIHTCTMDTHPSIGPKRSREASATSNV